MYDSNTTDPNNLSTLNRLHIHDELIKLLITHLPAEGKKELTTKLAELQNIEPLTDHADLQKQYINSFSPK